MSRVVVLLIEDEDYAWEVLEAAGDQEWVSRSMMVNPDNTHSIADLVKEYA